MTEPTNDDDDAALTEEITEALIAARREGETNGVNALKQLRARLELVDPPAVLMRSQEAAAAFRLGHGHAIQAARAEAATVLANLIRSVNHG